MAYTYKYANVFVHCFCIVVCLSTVFDSLSVFCEDLISRQPSLVLGRENAHCRNSKNSKTDHIFLYTEKAVIINSKHSKDRREKGTYRRSQE